MRVNSHAATGATQNDKETGKQRAKYDAALVIKMWEGGMRPSEIRRSDKPGVKGISSPFARKAARSWIGRREVWYFHFEPDEARGG